jgi:hypothetical protein
MVLAEERNMSTWKKNKEEWGYNKANEEIMVQEEVSEVRMGPIVCHDQLIGDDSN